MRFPTRRDVLRAGVGAGTLALTGCTSQAGSSTETTARPTPQQRGTVGMDCNVDNEEGSFLPSLQWIETGATVTWSVESSCGQRTVAYHPDNDSPLRIPENADPWASDYMHGDRSTFEFTFDVPGVYNYYGVFEEYGQVGIIVVGNPDAEGQPGLTPPQDSIPADGREKLQSLITEAKRILD